MWLEDKRENFKIDAILFLTGGFFWQIYQT